MARTGRKRAPGRKRLPNGRQSRAGVVQLFDRGSEWVQKMREKYGQDYSSALGRAYAAGLLGDDDIGKMRYDDEKMAAAATRKRFARFNPDRPDKPEENFGDGENRVRRAAMTHGSQALLSALRRDHPHIVAQLTARTNGGIG